MNCSLPKNTYPTFRQLLLAKIHKVLNVLINHKVTKRSQGTEISEDSIEISRVLNVKDTLKRVRKSTSVVVYRSSIALRLAAIWQQDVTKIALEITEMLPSIPIYLLEEDIQLAQWLFRDLTVKVAEARLLELEFGDRAIATWLQAIVDRLEPSPVHHLRKNSAFNLNADERRAVFLCQQTYARCGSLLRMAEELKLLNPSELQALPWLTPEEKLRLSHLHDRALISEIVTILDELHGEREIPPLKLAASLSQQFQNFHRDCRIFGAVAAQDRQLAQARLGLVMITHSLLRTVLEDELGVCAPRSL